MKRANTGSIIILTLLLVSLVLANAVWAEDGEDSLVKPVPPPAPNPQQPVQPQTPPGGFQAVPNNPYWQAPQNPQVPNPNPYNWWSYPPGWNNPYNQYYYWNNPYGQGDQTTPPEGWTQPDQSSPYGWNQDQPYWWGNPYYWGYPYGWNSPYGWGDSYGWTQPDPRQYWNNPQTPYNYYWYPPYGYGMPSPNDPYGYGTPYGQPPQNVDPNQQYG